MALAMPPAVVNSFTVREAEKLTGLSKSMIDYLCRQKLLNPSVRGRRGRGCPRNYSFGDVVMIRVIKALLDGGVSVMRLKMGLRALRAYHPGITPSSLPGKYLVTDGKSVFLRRGNDTIEALDNRGQMAFAFVVQLGPMRDEVAKRAVGMNSAKGG